MKKLLLYGALGIFLIGIVVAVLEDVGSTPATGASPSVSGKSVPAQATPVEPLYAKPGEPQRKPGQPDPVLLAKLQAAQAEMAAEVRLKARKKQEQAAAQRQADLRKAKQRQAQLQPGRKQLIQKLISLGIFSKVEMPGNLPHVWITLTFRRLDFDDKQKFLNVVYAYYLTENRRSNIVVLKDSRTGKRIGTYSQYGLDLD